MTNYKWSYVRDYEIALCNYFSVACKVFGSYNAYKESYVAFADNAKNITSKVAPITNNFVTWTRCAQPVFNQTAVYKVGYEWINEVQKLSDNWGKSLKLGIVDDGFDYVEEFGRINAIYSKRMNGFELPISSAAVPERFHFSEKLKMEYLPLPLKGSESVAKTIKNANTVIDGAGYVLIWANGLVNSYDTVASIATFASIDHEYDNSLYILQTIIDHSNIDEMRNAAKNLKKTVENDRETFADVWRPLASAAVETGKTVGVGLAVKSGAKFGPWLWAVDLGISLGNVAWHIGELDNKVLTCVALGNASECLSGVLSSHMYVDGNGYYSVNDEGIDLINQLAQLRIYGEDQFKSTTARYPGLIDKLYEIIEDDKLSTSTSEACESNKQCVVDISKKSLLLYSTVDYE